MLVLTGDGCIGPEAAIHDRQVQHEASREALLKALQLIIFAWWLPQHYRQENSIEAILENYFFFVKAVGLRALRLSPIALLMCC
jgi:hypothetical protein